MLAEEEKPDADDPEQELTPEEQEAKEEREKLLRQMGQKGKRKKGRGWAEDGLKKAPTVKKLKEPPRRPRIPRRP